MKIMFGLVVSFILAAGLAAQEVPVGRPAASVDLTTVEGAKLVAGEWRYSDTKIIEADFRSAGADNQPTGSAVKTYDYSPHAGGADFDDAKWEKIAATDLSKRRGNGRLSFMKPTSASPRRKEWPGRIRLTCLPSLHASCGRP